MTSIDDLRAERIRKLQLLRDKGIDPYPSASNRTHTASEAIKNFDSLSERETLTLAGRVMSIRGHGGLVFIDIYDGSDSSEHEGKIQCYLKEDLLGEDELKFLLDVVDVGDFIEFTGKLTITKRGEKSILADSWRMLTKSLRPLPEKWHGLKDVEERLRRRYLDILFDEDLRTMVEQRSKFWNAIRQFHIDNGFTEVETPTLELTTGGADANPFVTHHDALDLDVYLRISAGELWQKRLMSAGIPKTFEIGRIFRNEGMSPEHAQDYTQCEAYWAYANGEQMWNFLRECYQHAAQEAFGTMEFSIHGQDIDLSGEWPTIDYTETIKDKTGIDIWKDTEKSISNKLNDLGIESDGDAKPRLVDSLWKYCRKTITGPAILINEPTFMSPLSKSKPDNKDVVERFHFIIAGSEVGQGYSELNDPLDQRARFEEQQSMRDRGDKEAQMADWDFVEMLEHGMPPTAGHGFSERLFAFLSDRPIREAQIFPLMKPKGDDSDTGSKQTKSAIVVINSGVGLERWQELNAVAHLNAAFGARSSQNLFTHDTVSTKDGIDIKLNIRHAIMIKTAENSADIRELVENAHNAELEVSEYTREMLETTSDKKVEETTSQKNLIDVEHLGVLIFGGQKEVEALTKNFDLYK